MPEDDANDEPLDEQTAMLWGEVERWTQRQAQIKADAIECREALKVANRDFVRHMRGKAKPMPLFGG